MGTTIKGVILIVIIIAAIVLYVLLISIDSNLKKIFNRLDRINEIYRYTDNISDNCRILRSYLSDIDEHLQQGFTDIKLQHLNKLSDEELLELVRNSLKGDDE